MTPQRVFDVPEVLLSQVITSEEVRMVPDSPTATNLLFPQEYPKRPFDVPEVLLCHVVPSEYV